MNRQITDTLLMIEPVAFGFNQETASNNLFQQNDSTSPDSIQEKALSEFKAMVAKLKKHGIHVIVVKDTKEPHTPDSIFPNNWISFHQDGRVALYPMYAPNRRKEKREDILDILEEKGFYIEETIDFSQAEKENVFLEGTGSMILDRVHQIAYAAVSERTDEELFIEFCEDFEFTPIVFHATQKVEDQEFPIYHTNVMMNIAEDFAIVCFDSIRDPKEKKLVSDFLHTTQKEVISISEEQMNQFAGNTMQVESKNKDKYLVMSNSAYQSLNAGQINTISRYTKILVVDVPTIEKYGGGSVRCMMAEVFLQKEETRI